MLELSHKLYYRSNADKVILDLPDEEIGNTLHYTYLDMTENFKRVMLQYLTEREHKIKEGETFNKIVELSNGVCVEVNCFVLATDSTKKAEAEEVALK
jgi:hypothetical protein